MRVLHLTVLLALASTVALGRTAQAQQTQVVPQQPPPAAAAPVLVPPELVRKVDPVYPEQALKEKKAGEVILVLDLDAEGKVTTATVQKGAGFGMDEAAQAAALQLLFKPATRDGKPVRARIQYRMSFTLKEAPSKPAERTAATLPTGRIQGLVRLGQTAIPFAGAQVRVQTQEGRVVETMTDANGRWEVVGVAAGKVSVQVSSPGYGLVAGDETVGAGEVVEITYRLRALEGAIEVRIQGERPDREVTRRSMDRQELTLVPGTGGDALKAVQAMPGVARTPVFGGLIVVRGSSPYGTATFIDGTYVPAIYHFGGLSSVVPTEMIESLDFYPGNFSAKYGRVTGGIIDVRLREMEYDGKYHGLAQVDLIDARVLLRGPVPLLKGWSFNIAGRRSHVDAWIGAAMGDSATLRTAPVYYDWQAFLETKPTKKSSFRIGMFGSDDRLAMVLSDAIETEPGMGNSFKGEMRMMRLQAVYKNAISDSVNLNATASIGMDKEYSKIGSISSVDLDYVPMVFRGDLSWKLSKQFLFRIGPDVLVYHYKGTVRSIRPPEPGQQEGAHLNRQMLYLDASGYLSGPAGFAELEWTPTERAKVLLGGRLDYFNGTKKWDVSPRLNARYDIHHGFPRTTVKAGVGLFYELPQVIQVVEVFGTPNLKSNRSIHSSVGIEQQLAENVEVSVEVFHKYLDNLVVAANQSDGNSGFTNLGEGYAYGTETLVRWKPDGKFFGWLAYTNMRSMRKDGPNEPTRLFEFDQSHILTVLGSYELGRGWRLGGKFRLVSGSPYTPCNGGILNGATATYECLSGRPYSQRMPPFHQLDVRVDKTWTFTAWKLTTYLDVQNVYNRTNAEGVSYNYNFTSPRYSGGLPIIPSIGVRGEF